MQALFSIALLLGFAGQVLSFSFNVTLGGQLFLPKDLVPANLVPAPCTSNCTAAQNVINQCNNDTGCLCRADVVASLQTCEQCMFSQLIITNKRANDPRIGSSPLMAGYSTACADAQVKLAANQTALALPPSWDGPFVAILPTAGTVVTVGVGAMLGFSALMLLSNIE